MKIIVDTAEDLLAEVDGQVIFYPFNNRRNFATGNFTTIKIYSKLFFIACIQNLTKYIILVGCLVQYAWASCYKALILV